MRPIIYRKAFNRTTTPFDGGLSPLTDKSRGVPLFGNTPLIQDLLNGNNEGFNDIHGRGAWSNEPDHQQSFKEPGDQYRIDEAVHLLDVERAKGNRKHPRWVAEMEDGSQYEFPNKDVAQSQLRLMGKPFRRLFRRVAADVNVVSSVVDACVGVQASGDKGSGVGAAFCIDDGRFLTCAHVIKPYEIGSATNPGIFTSSDVSVNLTKNGKSIPAKVIGVSVAKDVALLEANFPSGILRLTPSINHDQGESVLVVGSPKGFENEVSEGILGGLDRVVFVHEGAPRHAFTDAKILPGNSGGPMVSLVDGGVIGMIEIIVGDQSTYGLNAAIETEFLLEALKEMGFEIGK